MTKPKRLEDKQVLNFCSFILERRHCVLSLQVFKAVTALQAHVTAVKQQQDKKQLIEDDQFVHLVVGLKKAWGGPAKKRWPHRM